MPISVKFPLYPTKEKGVFKEAEFKFSVPTVLELEDAAGMSIDMLRLRGQHVKAVQLLLCYGLKWNDEAMNDRRATRLLTKFVEGDGDISKLAEKLKEALLGSGVYGPPESAAAAKDKEETEEEDDDEKDDDGSPTEPKAAEN